MIKIPDETVAQLKKKQYALEGHSAVQICSWNKKALQGRGVCYKQKFYGIHTHRCMQFSPAAIWCSNRCLYCWRPVELMRPEEFTKPDSPEIIVGKLTEARKRLLSGFGGREGIDLSLWRESLIPDHYAISLSGEPTIYPKLPELILYLYRIGARSIFLVTNGTFPRMLRKLRVENALPHQLYISMVAPDKALYVKIARPLLPDSWERFNESLILLRGMPTRTVVRLTLIKGMNDTPGIIGRFADLINKSGTDFVEVKAYMFLGCSRNRLSMENMPLHSEVAAFSRALCQLLPDYELVDEHKPSRIVLLKNKKVEKKEIFTST